LRGLCFQLKYQQPDVICVEAHAIGPMDQALRVIRGRHIGVPIILLTQDPNPGLNPIRHGYYAVLSHPVDGEHLMVVAAHAIAHQRMLKRIQQLEVEAAGSGFAGMHGTTAFARRMFRKLQAYAMADVHVLLMGEAGTGKTLAARAIHDHSARARGPFIAMACERLSETAFSADSFINAPGAPNMRRHGALDDADRGTLFLANIDALSLRLQGQLLEALSENSQTDFRLIASTSVNLQARVQQGQFRPELLSHLSQSQLLLLPLRSRPGDIAAIGQSLLDQMTRDIGKPRVTLGNDAIEALHHHRFLRNVAELKEVLASALMRCTGSTLRATCLPAMLQVPTIVNPELGRPASQPPDSSAQRRQVLFEILSQKPMKIRDLERCAIEATLQRTGDNVTQAMRELGIGRTTLYRKLKKYGRR
jgi:DNA-binding NtrC family response regulator